MEESIYKEQSKQEFVSFEEYKRIAKQLLEKYDTEITSQANQDINGWKEKFSVDLYQNAISHYMNFIPEEVQKDYWAHGINRGRDLEWVTAALNFLPMVV